MLDFADSLWKNLHFQKQEKQKAPERCRGRWTKKKTKKKVGHTSQKIFFGGENLKKDAVFFFRNESEPYGIKIWDSDSLVSCLAASRRLLTY